MWLRFRSRPTDQPYIQPTSIQSEYVYALQQSFRATAAAAAVVVAAAAAAVADATKDLESTCLWLILELVPLPYVVALSCLEEVEWRTQLGITLGTTSFHFFTVLWQLQLLTWWSHAVIWAEFCLLFVMDKQLIVTQLRPSWLNSAERSMRSILLFLSAQFGMSALIAAAPAQKYTINKDVRGVAQSFWRRPYKIFNTGWILIQLGLFERREYTELEKYKKYKKYKGKSVFFSCFPNLTCFSRPSQKPPPGGPPKNNQLRNPPPKMDFLIFFFFFDFFFMKLLLLLLLTCLPAAFFKFGSSQALFF